MMLRIIAGKYKGRKINSAKNLKVRPTKSVVREAIFNILTSRVSLEGCSVLDLFCGTGALAFESLSRGAKHAYLADWNYYNLEAVKSTANDLNLSDNVTLIYGGAEKLPMVISKVDIVFIDPPYNTNLIEYSLNKLIETKWLKESSIIVIETHKEKEISILNNYLKLLERKYGITKLVILKYVEE